MRTYPQNRLDRDSRKLYAPIRAADWRGVLKSKKVNFTIVADMDSDNYYYPIPYGKARQIKMDCDDTDPKVHPGMKEIKGNGKDDDCNPATPDK